VERCVALRYGEGLDANEYTLDNTHWTDSSDRWDTVIIDDTQQQPGGQHGWTRWVKCQRD